MSHPLSPTSSSSTSNFDEDFEAKRKSSFVHNHPLMPTPQQPSSQSSYQGTMGSIGGGGSGVGAMNSNHRHSGRALPTVTPALPNKRFSSSSSSNLTSVGGGEFNSANVNSTMNSNIPIPINRGDPVSAFLRGNTLSSSAISGTATANTTILPPKQKLSLDQVPFNKTGLLLLSENSCWREIRALCERCLQFGFAPHENLLYRYAMILSQFRLHHYDAAAKQLDSLGDLNNSGNYFYESYPHIYNGNNGNNNNKKAGNMVPFSMLLLKAMMPHFESSAASANNNNNSSATNNTTTSSLAPPQPTSISSHGNTPNTPSSATIPTLATPSSATTNANTATTNTTSEPIVVNHLNSHSVTGSSGSGSSGGGGAGTQIALDRLYRLLNMCRRPHLRQRHDPNCSLDQWSIREQRVIMMIINCHIVKREYYLAQELLAQVVERLEKRLKRRSQQQQQQSGGGGSGGTNGKKKKKDDNGGGGGSEEEEGDETLETYILFRSLQGCLYLQTGIITEAEAIFGQLKHKLDFSCANHRVRAFLNEGYMLFAKGRTADACREFQCALEVDPDHVVAANNQAICLLHMCQLSKAIELLEDVIRRNPATNLDEVLVYNLCTLYDLEADPTSNEKIQVIRILTERYAGEDFIFSH